MNADRTRPPLPETPQTLPEFMAQALWMEREAVARYTELAEALESHNNREVAALFRTMAGYEARHAEQIMAEMGWQDDAAVPRLPPGRLDADVGEMPALDSVHYLMQPWHALQLALAAERRAEAFFAMLARLAVSEPVRQAALQLQAEEAGHVALVQAWIEKVPVPDPDWADDPDPPRYTD